MEEEEKTDNKLIDKVSKLLKKEDRGATVPKGHVVKIAQKIIHTSNLGMFRLVPPSNARTGRKANAGPFMSTRKFCKQCENKNYKMRAHKEIEQKSSLVS